MVSAIEERHASEILLFLLERGEIKKTDLLKVVSSSDSLSRVLRILNEDGFINIETKIAGRKIIHINLTPKGRAVAEQIKKADEAARGIVIHEDEGKVEVSNTPSEWKEKWKNLHALIRVNVYDEHVSIMETNHEGTGKERIFNIYIRENEHGQFRLWCELDESFDCYHVGYALTLAPVQDMFARVRGGK
jgi:DNA-binding MarR family transcriptional regulator